MSPDFPGFSGFYDAFDVFNGVSSQGFLPQRVLFEGVKGTSFGIPTGETAMPPMYQKNRFTSIGVVQTFNVEGGPGPFQEVSGEIRVPIETAEEKGATSTEEPMPSADRPGDGVGESLGRRETKAEK